MPIDDKDAWSLWLAEGVSVPPPVLGDRWPSVNECTQAQKTKAITVVMIRRIFPYQRSL